MEETKHVFLPITLRKQGYNSATLCLGAFSDWASPVCPSTGKQESRMETKLEEACV